MFWSFDLDQGRVTTRAELARRPSQSLKTISNGRLLYIYNAGATLDMYDAPLAPESGSDSRSDSVVGDGGPPKGGTPRAVRI